MYNLEKVEKEARMRSILNKCSLILMMMLLAFPLQLSAGPPGPKLPDEAIQAKIVAIVLDSEQFQKLYRD